MLGALAKLDICSVTLAWALDESAAMSIPGLMLSRLERIGVAQDVRSIGRKDVRGAGGETGRGAAL